MTKYLSGNEDDFNKIIHKTDINNLDVIPSGLIPPNPSEMLGSNKMNDLMQTLASEYDLLLSKKGTPNSNKNKKYEYFKQGLV